MEQETRAILDELNIDIMDDLMDRGFIVTGLRPDFRLLYANALLIRMLGYDSLEELQAGIGHSAIRLAAPEDQERIKAESAERSSFGLYEMPYYLRCKNGEKRYVLQRSRHKTLKNGREVIIVAFFDAQQLDRQERMELVKRQLRTESKAEHAEKKFRIAMENSNLIVWECDIKAKRNIYPEEIVKRMHVPAVIEDVPEGLIATGMVHPNSEKQLREMYNAVMSGEPHAEGVIAALHDNETQWLKMSLTTLYSEDGEPESAVCTAEDITREKTLLQKMEEELERRAAYEVNQRGIGSFDLTTEQILEYSSCFLEHVPEEKLSNYSVIYTAAKVFATAIVMVYNFVSRKIFLEKKDK